MEHTKLTELLNKVAQGEVSVEKAALELKTEPFEDLGFAKLDHHRKIRQGAAEVIYGAGKTPEQILDHILGEFGLEILDKTPVNFYCNCDKKRVEKALISIGKKELQDMIDEGKEIEVNCHFCNRNYSFSVEELKEMLNKAAR